MNSNRAVTNIMMLLLQYIKSIINVGCPGFMIVKRSDSNDPNNLGYLPDQLSASIRPPLN